MQRHCFLLGSTELAKVPSPRPDALCPVPSPSSPLELIPTGLPTKRPQVSTCAAPHPRLPQGEDECDSISPRLQRGLSLLPFRMAAPWQILKQECSPIKCTLSV